MKAFLKMINREGILINNIKNDEKENIKEKGVFKDEILVEKQEFLKFEKENIFEIKDVNIEITHEDNWEVTIVKRIYRHKKIIKKNGTKKHEDNKNEKNEIINDEIKENEMENEIKNETNKKDENNFENKNERDNKEEIKNKNKMRLKSIMKSC